MSRRPFGRTGVEVSEVGFGAWAIGGKSYGRVDRSACLEALARAESLGCNFVDTAEVYGNSEEILGEFLRGRRDRWIVATKYSGQPEGMTATLERQLRRLGTDTVDLYQIHWVPENDDRLLAELQGLKRSGKTRLVGVSARSAGNIDFVLDGSGLDSIMIPFSLLDPFPFVSRVKALASSGIAVIVRSALKEGFLAGKYARNASFPDADDQRHAWSPERIAQTVDDAERFRFLEDGHPSLAVAAIRYPLSFAFVSTVIVGAKTAADAEANFGVAHRGRLSPAELERVWSLQQELKLGTLRQRWSHAVRQLFGA
jgi:aryl-alcohol dehydrogenase-like predicted oxidoreductase